MYGKYQTTYEGLFSGGIRIDDLMENGGSNRPKNVLINEWEIMAALYKGNIS